MKRSLLGLVTACCLIAATPSPARSQVMSNPISGNDLLRLCRGWQDSQLLRDAVPAEAGQCLGFIIGITDAFGLAEYLPVIGEKKQCVFDVPTGSVYQQQLDVVQNYIIAHPELRQFPAAHLAVLALKKAFPCP